MATKEKPGAFDCYANARLDEPMFVLLARDELAPHLTKIWTLIRNKAPQHYIQTAIEDAQKAVEHKPPMDRAKYAEACNCALAMMGWKSRNPNV